MDINFLERELKSGKVEFPNIRFCYLIAIKNQNPKIWAQMKTIIEMVEEEANGGKLEEVEKWKKLKQQGNK